MSLAYLSLKTVHQLCALTTFVLFITRGLWILRNPESIRPRWMLIVPHVVDTVLLASAIALVVITQQYPGSQVWLNAKIVALLGYIFLGLIAFRFARNHSTKVTAWVIGQLVFVYIVLVALTRSPTLYW
ncbi:MAG: SirB2 family protein [Gammaproteobacteria bacterium]|nr:SirB2 family protein [Gammaproteobacteria bacterium]